MEKRIIGKKIESITIINKSIMEATLEHIIEVSRKQLEDLRILKNEQAKIGEEQEEFYDCAHESLANNGKDRTINDFKISTFIRTFYGNFTLEEYRKIEMNEDHEFYTINKFAHTHFKYGFVIIKKDEIIFDLSYDEEKLFWKILEDKYYGTGEITVYEQFRQSMAVKGIINRFSYLTADYNMQYRILRHIREKLKISKTDNPFNYSDIIFYAVIDTRKQTNYNKDYPLIISPERENIIFANIFKRFIDPKLTLKIWKSIHRGISQDYSSFSIIEKEIFKQSTEHANHNKTIDMENMLYKEFMDMRQGLKIMDRADFNQFLYKKD